MFIDLAHTLRSGGTEFAIGDKAGWERSRDKPVEDFFLPMSSVERVTMLIRTPRKMFVGA